MTNLGNEVVARTKRGFITHKVSGDLSHSYAYRPNKPGFETPEGFGGIGLRFPSKSATLKFARSTEKKKMSWKKQIKLYDKKFGEGAKREMRFGYLRPKAAKPYAAYAYGEVAEKVRKKFHIKERKY